MVSNEFGMCNFNCNWREVGSCYGEMFTIRKPSINTRHTPDLQPCFLIKTTFAINPLPDPSSPILRTSHLLSQHVLKIVVILKKNKNIYS